MIRYVSVPTIMVVILYLSSQFGFAQNLSIDKAVLTQDNAYILMPVELIAGPVVTQKSIAPDGTNMLLVRTVSHLGVENIPTDLNPKPSQPVVTREVIYWNANTHRSMVVWKTSESNIEIQIIGMMTNTDSFYFTVTEAIPADPNSPREPPKYSHKLMRISSRMTYPQDLNLPQGITDVSLDFSPKLSFGIARLSGSNPDTGAANYECYLIDNSGRLVKRILMPSNHYGGVILNEEGDMILRDRSPNAPFQYFLIDPRKGTLTLLPGAPKRYSQSNSVLPALPLQVVSRRMNLEDIGLKKESATVLILDSSFKSKQSKSLIAADGTEPVLTSGREGVFYISQNAAWYLPLLKIGKADYLAMKKRADRIRVISNARQVGLAILMCAQDYDDTFPTPDSINDKIGPYLKNDSLLDGFNYTYAGGSLADMKNPSTTTIGYVDGEGGRANIYGDGHVKWVDN